MKYLISKILKNMFTKENANLERYLEVEFRPQDRDWAREKYQKNASNGTIK